MPFASPLGRASTSASALSHRKRTVAGAACGACSARSRVRTRCTLPSTMGVRTPYAMLAIAPAVYRPTPGICFSSTSGSLGSRPVVSTAATRS